MEVSHTSVFICAICGFLRPLAGESNSLLFGGQRLHKYLEDLINSPDVLLVLLGFALEVALQGLESLAISLCAAIACRRRTNTRMILMFTATARLLCRTLTHAVTRAATMKSECHDL
jgi:hypothetical protein